MAQAVSRQPLTMGTRVHTRVSAYAICGAQSGTGSGFSPSSSVFHRQHYSSVGLHTHIIWGTNNMPVGGRSSET
jgi:hypothetical protein